MSAVIQRVDQIAITIRNPSRHVRHYTQEEIRGVIINFSPEDLYIDALSGGSPLGGFRGHYHPDIPKVLPAHSSTGEIVLLTIEINRDEIDPYENLILGSFGFQYHDAAGNRYATERALFQLLLQ